MGTIVDAFGIQGWVKIRTDNPTSLAKYTEIFLVKDTIATAYNIEKSSIKENVLNAKLAHINDRDQAIALKGTVVNVPRSSFPKTQESEYYWVDLIGLDVINQQDHLIGKVVDLIATGANDVLVIINDDKEYLIPFIKQQIIDVNLTDKQIIVDWDLTY